MKLLACMLFSLVFFGLLEKPVKKRPVIFYGATVVIAVLSLATGLMIPAKSLPAPLSYILYTILARGTLAGAIFLLVMAASVLPNSKVKQFLMRQRGEMAIIASLFTLIHNIAYGKWYFVKIFTNPSLLSPYELAAAILSLMMILLLIPLTITSFQRVRKRIKAPAWKKLQRWSYLFYGLLFIHISLIFSGPIRMGRRGYILDLAIYALLYLIYLVLRIKRFPKQRNLCIGLMAIILLIFAGVCLSAAAAPKDSMNQKSASSEAPENSPSSPEEDTTTQGVPDPSSLPDGTYEGSGTGYAGPTDLSVTIEGGKITAIQIVQTNDTEDYFLEAKEGVIKAILEQQTPDVDTVSGATYSSKGIIEAVKDALSKAGK